jgi:cytochrome c2
LGAYFLIGLLLFVVPATAAELCLTCHPAHYAQIGGCSDCHRGNPLSGRQNVAHSGLVAGRFARFIFGSGDGVVRDGERLLEEMACRRCHRIDGRGNRLAADLDRAARVKAPDLLAAAIREPVAGMPRFELDEKREASAVTALLAAAHRRSGPPAAAEVVHFNAGGAGGNVFARRCGACHRIMSAELGPSGSGTVGPNLTGLLSPFYPRSFRGSEPWTMQNLGVWLKNPRKITKTALMRPVPLPDDELRKLALLLTPPH